MAYSLFSQVYTVISCYTSANDGWTSYKWRNFTSSNFLQL